MNMVSLIFFGCIILLQSQCQSHTLSTISYHSLQTIPETSINNAQTSATPSDNPPPKKAVWKVSSSGSLFSFDELMYKDKFDSTALDTLDTLSYKSVSGNLKLGYQISPLSSAIQLFYPWMSISTYKASLGTDLEVTVVEPHMKAQASVETETRTLGNKPDSLYGISGSYKVHGSYPFSTTQATLTPKLSVAGTSERYNRNTFSTVSYHKAEITPSFSIDYEPWMTTGTVSWIFGKKDARYSDTVDYTRNCGQADISCAWNTIDLNLSASLDIRENAFWNNTISNYYPSKRTTRSLYLWVMGTIIDPLSYTLTGEFQSDANLFPNYYVLDSLEVTKATIYFNLYSLNIEFPFQLSKKIEISPSLAYEDQGYTVDSPDFEESIKKTVYEKISNAFIPGITVACKFNTKLSLTSGIRYRMETVVRDYFEGQGSFTEISPEFSMSYDPMKQINFRVRYQYYMRTYQKTHLQSSGIYTSAMIFIEL